MKSSLRLYGCVLCGVLALPGCTSSFSRVAETVAAAPDWYAERRDEVVGRGYPSVSRVPAAAATETDRARLAAIRGDVGVAEALVRMDPRAVPPALELERMLAWSREARAAAEALDTPGDFLTDEEAQALRARFETDRAQS